MNILVLCTGNICRSPFAAALLKRLMPSADVSSAGLQALLGSPASKLTQQLALRHQLDLTHHIAMQLDASSLRCADIVLVMEREQVQKVVSSWPFMRGRVFRLGEYRDCDIPDPYRETEKFNADVQALMVACVDDWRDRLEKYSVVAVQPLKLPVQPGVAVLG